MIPEHKLCLAGKPHNIQVTSAQLSLIFYISRLKAEESCQAILWLVTIWVSWMVVVFIWEEEEDEEES